MVNHEAKMKTEYVAGGILTTGIIGFLIWKMTKKEPVKTDEEVSEELIKNIPEDILKKSSEAEQTALKKNIKDKKITKEYMESYNTILSSSDEELKVFKKFIGEALMKLSDEKNSETKEFEDMLKASGLKKDEAIESTYKVLSFMCKNKNVLKEIKTFPDVEYIIDIFRYLCGIYISIPNNEFNDFIDDFYNFSHKNPMYTMKCLDIIGQTSNDVLAKTIKKENFVSTIESRVKDKLGVDFK